MADGYWNRQQASLLPSGGMLKRPRSDYGTLFYTFFFFLNSNYLIPFGELVYLTS